MFLVSIFAVQKNVEMQEPQASTYYEESQDYLRNLNVSSSDDYISSSSLATYYNLSNYYPLICENQTSSNFCWIYSSMKSLESALMVQTNEFYNFSEAGLAYLYYYNKTGVSSNAYNITGNFETFVNAYKAYGLIFESDFSNEEYENIYNSTNKKTYYNHVLDYATTDLNSMISPYDIGTDSYYSKLDTDDKITTIKKFIKKYGAVFAGLEGSEETQKGCFVEEQGSGINYFYDYDRKHANFEPLDEPHAICVVGWNDEARLNRNDATSCTGAFIVMNSWGFSSGSKDYFYVPYDYVNFYSTFCGFICEQPSDEEIILQDNNNSSFTSSILQGNSQINNYFCYNDSISLSYKLNLASFSDLSVRVTGGGQDYTGDFTISYDNSNKKVYIDLNKSSDFYGGYYTINFYGDSELFGKRSVFVYSGTEIDCLEIDYNYTQTTGSSTKSVTDIDSYALKNAFLNKNSTTTIYVSSKNDCYFISMSLAYVSKMSTIGSNWKNFTMTVSDVEVISTSNSTLETKYTSAQLANGLFKENTNSGSSNSFVMQIGYALKLSEFEDSVIRFKFTISSVVYDNCARDFYVNMFVTSKNGAKTSDLNQIVYFLDEGQNNPKNVTRFPAYTADEWTTTVQLFSPTKLGSVFVGWYTNPNFNGDPVTKIYSGLIGDIKLYAKWQVDGVNYFDIALVLGSVTNYNGANKALPCEIVYGDTVIIALNFKETASLKDFSYTVNYYLNWGNNYLEEGGNDLVLAGDNLFKKDFTLSFPQLTSGEQTIRVKVKVKIADTIEVIKQTYCSFTVQKQKVTFSFSNLEVTYNGAVQKPSLSNTGTSPKITCTGFYTEDTSGKSQNDLFSLTCSTNSKDAGTHIWTVSSINNKNYDFENQSEAKGSLVIKPRTITISWKSYSQTYDGYNHFPQFNITNLISGDSLSFDFYDVSSGNALTECKDAGHYNVNINPASITNSNYTVDTLGSSIGDFEFDILPAKITIELFSVTDRLQTKPAKRIRANYKVYGSYYSIADIDIKIISEAHNATSSGTYSITCKVGSSNYQLENSPTATYTLTGYYYVYYTLSNGKVFSEKVEEGGTPSGVTKEDFNAPKFSKITYSNNYYITGDDVYVDVELQDYTTIVYGGIFVAAFLLVCIIYFYKKRESKVR